MGCISMSVRCFAPTNIFAFTPDAPNVCQVGVKILKQTSEKQGWLHFTCLAPDGNAVEID